MVIVIEHLKGKYLNQQNKVYLINPSKYQPYEHSIIKLIQWMLRTMFPKIENERIELMASHARGFYWYPFRRALAELCRSVGLEIKSAERNKFVEIRNELVHRMGFHSNLGSAWEQYTFSMTFVGKALLATLDYDGYFYDWTKPQRWIGEEMQMRKKLDLGLRKS